MRSGTMDQLFCTVCGYNLTGIADPDQDQQACSECGQAFSATTLAAQQFAQRIDTREALLRLLPLPGICFLCSVIPVVSLVTMPIAVVTTLIRGGFIAADLGRRLVLTRAASMPLDQAAEGLRRSTAVWTAVGLWCVQVVLAGVAAFGGCSIALVAMN